MLELKVGTQGRELKVGNSRSGTQGRELKVGESLFEQKQDSNNTFKDAYIPKTFEWGNKPVCSSEDDEFYYSETPNCCSSGYDVSGTIEIAYEEGLENHPGIQALEKGGGCVHPSDLEILLDELSMYPSENQEEKLKYSLNECKNLVSNILSHHYGKLKEITEKDGKI